MVSSQSNSAPHFVRSQPSGQYACDSTCLQWKSSQICSHSVAVAALNGDLEAFVKWYVDTHQQPNFTTLAANGLPAGRGRKGGIPKRSRSRSSSSCKRDISVPRPAVAYRDASSHLSGGGSVSSLLRSHLPGGGSVSSLPQSHLPGGGSVSSLPQSHLPGEGSVSSLPQSYLLGQGGSTGSLPQSHSASLD